MRWKNRPEGSNWGEFGPDDQLGRPNLITSEQVLKGAREIRAGLSFCLSLPLDYPGDNKLNVRRHPPVLRPTFKDGFPLRQFSVPRERRRMPPTLSATTRSCCPSSTRLNGTRSHMSARSSTQMATARPKASTTTASGRTRT